MIKQLLDEVRAAPLDDASRDRLAAIFETSVKELSESLSPDLRDELARLAPPFGGDVGAERCRAASRAGAARRLARGVVPRHPGHAVRAADAGPPAARGDAPTAAVRAAARCDRRVHQGRTCRESRMCRSIVTLRGEEAATSDEVRSAAVQYVRKISGYSKPSKANEAVFEQAVAEVAAATQRLLDGLVTPPEPVNPPWPVAGSWLARSRQACESIRLASPPARRAAHRRLTRGAAGPWQRLFRRSVRPNHTRVIRPQHVDVGVDRRWTTQRRSNRTRNG